MTKLFTPFDIKGTRLRNRIVMPPMCMYSAEADGRAKEWHSFHYRTRAQGGAALIIQEATAVDRAGRISDSDLGIWDDSHIPGLADIVRCIRAEGAAAAVQLAHAGRKCCAPGEDVLAPSPLNFNPEDPEYKTPRQMTIDDIDEVVRSFQDGAARAVEAGYDVLEIHGAHGYLISEFLSPLTNLRDDEYGGCAENRARFLLRIIRAVRKVWKEERVLILRVSADDYTEGGNRPGDVADIINLVKGEGVDLVDVSTGGVVPHAHIPAAPGFQIPGAALIKEQTGLPVAGGGLISDAVHADRILEEGHCDLVFFGRELLRNPYFPFLSAKAAGVELSYRPEQYLRS